MLLWSAALVIFCLVACFSAYNGPLYYHAWKWRKVNPEDKRDHFHSREEMASLEKATGIMVARRMSREKVAQLLGHSSSEYDFDGDHWVNYWVGPGPEHKVSICFEQNRAVFVSVNFRKPAIGRWGPAASPSNFSRTPNPNPKSPPPEAPQP